MIYEYKDIKRVHFEPTTRCNAACPMCPRYIDGGAGLNPHMPLASMSLETAKQVFLPEFVRQLDRLYACGNFGDPAACRDLIPIYSYFRSINAGFHLGLYSNGSLRTTEWWAELANIILLDGIGKGWVTFSIDGLADTNHLYRVGTNFNKIMENAQAFIDAGGYAEWEYLVFEHNQHQVEEARELARTMGFRDFVVKKTHRFRTPTLAVKNRHGDITHHIAPSSIESYRHASVDTGVPNPKEVTEVRIDCKVQPQGNLFVTATGHVFPCCYLAANAWTEHNELEPYLTDSMAELDATKYSIEQIVNGWFFKSVEKSWDKHTVGTNGRLATCTQVCGIKHRVVRERESMNEPRTVSSVPTSPESVESSSG